MSYLTAPTGTFRHEFPKGEKIAVLELSVVNLNDHPGRPGTLMLVSGNMNPQALLPLMQALHRQLIEGSGNGYKLGKGSQLCIEGIAPAEMPAVARKAVAFLEQERILTSGAAKSALGAINQHYAPPPVRSAFYHRHP